MANLRNKGSSLFRSAVKFENEPASRIFFESADRDLNRIEMHMKKFLLLLIFILSCAPLVQSQDEEKIQALLKDAIDTMGGDAYLKAVDSISEGQRFFFDSQGGSSSPIKFTRYAKYPDKSRFEVGNRKNELDISVFNLAKNEGWIQEGQKGVREAKPAELKEFKNAVKHSLDNIFRFRCKDPENKLYYMGPGEGQDMTLEMVKLLDPENDEVTIYFDRLTKLPAKIEYREVNSKGLRERFVEEYSDWHDFQGVNTPLRIDRYVNNHPLLQHFVIKINYNNNLADGFFSKPVPIKK
jgi:hypothetical protein